MLPALSLLSSLKGNAANSLIGGLGLGTDLA
jgi:hypothetical protein